MATRARRSPRGRRGPRRGPGRSRPAGGPRGTRRAPRRACRGTSARRRSPAARRPRATGQPLDGEQRRALDIHRRRGYPAGRRAASGTTGAARNPSHPRAVSPPCHATVALTALAILALALANAGGAARRRRPARRPRVTCPSPSPKAARRRPLVAGRASASTSGSRGTIGTSAPRRECRLQHDRRDVPDRRRSPRLRQCGHDRDGLRPAAPRAGRLARRVPGIEADRPPRRQRADARQRRDRRCAFSIARSPSPT